MNRERIILAYKNYFKDFISSLSDAERNESFMEKLKQIRRIAAIFLNTGVTLKQTIMSQETQNKAEYIVIFISEFARRFGLSAVQAYRYLNRYKAIDFLDEQYNVAHTQSFEDMVQNMAGYCQRHGGELA